MTIEKIDGIPKYNPIPSDKNGVKRYEQGELIKEVDSKGKTWIYKPTGKNIARGPLDKDTFEKQQPVDIEGKIINKDGKINN